jgi:epoxyqueuosine reductase
MMKKKLLDAAKAAKISEIGFVSAEIYYDLGGFLKNKVVPPFAENDLNKRINPFLIMEKAKSIIVILSSYHTNSNGEISEYARGKDYHIVLKEQMRRLINVLEKNGYAGIDFCDTGPLNERYLAYCAGLGFLGKNGFLINETYGSYTFIGYIITDCMLEAGEPMRKSCMGCEKCIQACPGGALSENGVDAQKCVSYLTQKNGHLTSEERDIIYKGGSVWGCDICQQVCPHNKYAEYSDIYAFSDNLISYYRPNERISGRKFKKMYKERAFAWRGKQVLERNYGIIHEKKIKND